MPNSFTTAVVFSTLFLSGSALPACTAAQDQGPGAKSAQEPAPAKGTDGQNTSQKLSGTANVQNPTIAKGEIVSEMSKSLMRVFQDKNHHYWFATDGQGVYRYDGKNIINFTTKDGLCSNRAYWAVQEDKSGNIYFTTPDGISKFDGRTFTTLSPKTSPSPMSEWKLEPDDLWFQAPQDAGLVYRYDGRTLHSLRFPKTKRGDEHYARLPRSKFPNAIYSPYDVYAILKDSRGHLWFGSTNLGVCRFDGKSFTWFDESGLADAPVRSIMEDRNGNLWFSYSGSQTFDGLRTAKGIGGLKEGLFRRICGSRS